MRDEIYNSFAGHPKGGAILSPPYWALGGPNSRKLRTPACVLALLSDDEVDRTRVRNLQEAVAIICQARIHPAPTPGEVEQIRAGLMRASDLIFRVSPPALHPLAHQWFESVALLADPATTVIFEDEVRLGYGAFVEDKPRYWVLCGQALHALIEMMEAISDGLAFLEASGVDFTQSAKPGETLPGTGRQARKV